MRYQVKQEEYQDLSVIIVLPSLKPLRNLYQRINPHIDMGQRTAQTIGEKNY